MGVDCLKKMDSNLVDNPSSEFFKKSNTNDQSTHRETSITRRFKLVLIGEHEVGKSAFIVRYTRNIYDEQQHIQTVGIEHYLKQWEYNGNSISFNIWDCACHRDYKKMMLRFIRDSAAILL